jgi:hypothetical protein
MLYGLCYVLPNQSSNIVKTGITNKNGSLSGKGESGEYNNIVIIIYKYKNPSCHFRNFFTFGLLELCF